MKFSTFVKMGGHAFSLLQNKDLMELYGIVKPGIQGQLKKIKETPAPPSGNAPAHFPVPIDSPFMHPYQVPPHQPHGTHFYGYPNRMPAYPPRKKN